MINERDKLILKKIIQSDRPLSGAYLSNICQVSINTIRKEISIINDYLTEYGCHIDIRVAIGYTLVIDDEAKARPFIAQLIKDINTFGYLNINDSQKINYIIKRLLSSNSLVPIETLMNELYCSKSTILRNIEKASEYLAQFHLEIKIRRNIGLYIDGKEWNKRMCLVHQHKIERHSVFDEAFEVKAFNVLFMDNTDYYERIKDAFLSLMPKYPILSFSHVDVPTIINFIHLCITRQSKDAELKFSKEQIETAHSLITHKFAKELLSMSPSYFRENCTEKTLDAISMIFAGTWKINKKALQDKSLYDNYRSDIEYAADYISHKFEISQIFDENFYEDMSLFLDEQRRRDLFEVYSDEENFRTTNKVGLFSSDLLALFAHCLKQKNGIVLNMNALNRAYSIFNSALFINQGFFAKQRFCVISRYGAYMARNIMLRIQANFTNMIEHIDIFEYSDIDSIDTSQYDAVISDISRRNFPLKLPLIEVDMQQSVTDFDSVSAYFENLRKSCIPEIFTEQDYIVADFQNEEEIYDTLYESILPDSMLKQEWITDCRQREELLTFKRDKEIVLMTSLDFESDKPIFKVLVSKKPVLWNSEHYRFFIYYHRGKGTPKECQTISYLCKLFTKKPEWFLNSLSSMTYEEVLQQF